MRWIILTILTILTAHSGAAAGAAQDPSLRPVGISCQGLIRRAASPLLRTSPGGTYTMEIMPAQDHPGSMQADIVVTSRGGERRRLVNVRGNGFFVSDAGCIIAFETPDSNVPPSFLRVFDLSGRELYAREVSVLSNPALSPDGSRLVYRTRQGIVVLDLATFAEKHYPDLDLFAAGPEGRLAGVMFAGHKDVGAREPEQGCPDTHELLVFADPEQHVCLRLGHRCPRRVAFTPDASAVLVLDSQTVKMVEIPAGSARVLFAAPDGAELRDLLVSAGAIYVGVRTVSDGMFAGELVTLAPDGRILDRRRGPSRRIPRAAHLHRSTRGIPWPIEPNAQHEVGNTYGEYQNYGGGGYLHPGVDAMGSPGQAVYAVRAGVVKAVLTTSGVWHWRVALGDSATAATCEGYLYAHLDQYSIAVDVGDAIALGQYLGDLVAWPVYDFTHIHFARIEDSGIQWYGNWLCTENPHLNFENQSEEDAPIFEPAVGYDLLAFCENQTSYYQEPDALHGQIDIIAHVGDTIESDWVCTVQEIRYTIYRTGFPNFPVVDDKLAVFFDMELDTYQGGPIDPFLVQLLFKRDSVCFTQGDYESREFYHIITNSDGDQVYEESDLWEAWDTALLPDGDYVIRVTAIDVVGNATVDSMIVTTTNGNPATVVADGSRPLRYRRYPNPGTSGVSIVFTLPSPGPVTLSIYDGSGRMVRNLTAGRLSAGRHTFTWNGQDSGGATSPSGIYFCRLATSADRRTEKLVLRRTP